MASWLAATVSKASVSISSFVATLASSAREEARRSDHTTSKRASAMLLQRRKRHRRKTDSQISSLAKGNPLAKLFRDAAAGTR